MKIDKYYMCHYSKLSERKNYIDNHLSQYDLDLEWVLDFDKEKIDWENIKSEYPLILEVMPMFGRKMSKPEISLCLKHIFVFKDVIENNYDNVVVFEDDIILDDNFSEKLSDYTNQLPKTYDILWIGSCCNLHANLVPDINVYKKDSSRCTHAYLISRKGCESMINNLQLLNFPIDWFFNFVIKKENLENYWAEPDLAKQDLSFDSAINAGLVE